MSSGGAATPFGRGGQPGGGGLEEECIPGPPSAAAGLSGPHSRVESSGVGLSSAAREALQAPEGPLTPPRRAFPTVASGGELHEDVGAVVDRLGHRRRPWVLPRLRGPERHAAAAFLAHQRGASLLSYARDLDDFALWCEDRRLGPLEVRRAHVDLWHRELEAAGRRPSTIARQLSPVSRFFRLAVDDELVERNPVAGVRRPRVGSDSPRLGLDRDQAHALLEAAAGAGVRDHALACLLVLNGLRISECIAVAAGDLGEGRGHRVVRVRRKGGAMVDVPLAPRTSAALEALAELRASDAGGVLFVDGEERPLDRFDAARIVRRLARRAGVRHRVSPHSLRHTLVTAALDAGVPLRDVQDAAGHADPRTTRRYDRGRHSLDRQATYAVARFLG